MPDWLCVDVMGTPIDVALSNLTPGEADAVRHALHERTLPRREGRDAVVLEARCDPGADPVAQVTRDLAEIAAERHPQHWWLRVAGTVVTSGGEIVLVCGELPASSPPAGAGLPFEGLVGIDIEGGVDPVLSMSGDFSWIEGAPNAARRLVPRSTYRLAQIVVAERTQGTPRAPEPLPTHEAVGLLMRLTVGAARQHRPRTVARALVRATGGVVRIGYADRAELRARIAELTGARTSTSRAADETDGEVVGLTQQSVDGQAAWAVGEDTIWRSSSDRTYVLNARDAEAPVVLRDSAHHIWSTLLAEKPCTVSRLAELVSAHYGSAVGDVEDGVGQLIQDLRARGLVHQV
jgi:hypothetical protein